MGYNRPSKVFVKNKDFELLVGVSVLDPPPQLKNGSVSAALERKVPNRFPQKSQQTYKLCHNTRRCTQTSSCNGKGD